MLECQNIKTFLQRVIFQIGQEKVLLLKKLKVVCRGHMLLMILMKKKLLEHFMKKQIKKSLELKKNSREKVINYVKWKGYDSSFNSWIDKKDIAKTSEYFPKPNSLEKNVKVEMDLSNYAAKTDIKNSIRIDTSSFAKKVDLASLKSDVDKLDINKLKNVPTNLKNLKSKVHKLDVHKLVPVPVELSKLSDVVKNDVVKKDVYNAKIKNIEYKIADITN